MINGVRPATLPYVALWVWWLCGVPDLAGAQQPRDRVDPTAVRLTRADPAPAPSATEDLAQGWVWGGAGVGYDSLPLFAIDPTQRSDVGVGGAGTPLNGDLGNPLDGDFVPPGQARRAMEGELVMPDGSPFLDLELLAGGQLGRTWHAGGELMFRGRAYEPGDHFFDAQGSLFAGWGNERWLARVQANGGRFSASFGRDDAWYTGAGVRSIYALTPALWLAGEMGVMRRSFDTAIEREDGGLESQADVRWGGGADVTGWWNRFMVSGGLRADRVQSNLGFVERTELFPWLAVAWQHAGWWVQGRYGPVMRRFDDRRQSGVEHLWRLDGQRTLTSWLSLYARADFGVARGREFALEYRRFEMSAGLRFAYGSGAARRSSLPPPSTAEQGPVRIGPDGVQFRVVVDDAEEVSVIGSFNDWDAAAGRLTSQGEGVFTGTFDVHPGRHRYQLLVDGEPRTPPGAQTYVGDDFGGRDAVLDVPAQ